MYLPNERLGAVVAAVMVGAAALVGIAENNNYTKVNDKMLEMNWLC